MIPGRTGQAQFDRRPQIFSAFCRGAAQKTGCVPYVANFGRKFAPDSIHSGEWDGWGRVRLPVGELAMGPAYPPHSKQKFLDESALRGEEHMDDEHSDDVVSLLEENARLRSLVVKLTDLILKNVADRK
jgi:hypothetical protein